MLTLSLLLASATVSNVQIEQDGRLLTATDLKTFLNAARCGCDAKFTLSFSVTPAPGEVGSMAVAYGKRCVDGDDRISDSCEVVWTGSLSGLSFVSFDLSGADLGCSGDATSGLQFLTDPLDDEVWSNVGSVELPVDTEAPDPPKNAKVLGGEGLAEVAFESSGTTETVKYQVLCTQAGDPVFEKPADAEFESQRDLCGDGDELLSAAFVCGEAEGGANSKTVDGLEDGVTYTFYVISIDSFGNPSAPVKAGDATPSPELDLWEVYKQQGGSADGGHCFVATAAYGDYDHPQVRVLRRFRDRVLARHAPALIDAYYETSPPLAGVIRDRPELRWATQVALWPLTLWASLSLEVVR